MSNPTAKVAALRRLLAKQGYLLRKSRDRNIHADNLGGYMIVDAGGNYVVRGSRFELDLDDVELFANE